MVGARLGGCAVAVALVWALLPLTPAAADAPPATTCLEDGTGGSCPTLIPATPTQATEISATRGTWSGTPAPTYTFQWQQCPGSTPDTCQDVDGQTGTGYVLPPGATSRVRVVVTATNTSGSAARASLMSGTPTVNPNAYPGKTQVVVPTVSVAPGSLVAPLVGDTFHGLGESFDPAATSSRFEWLRCDANGVHCAAIAGETGRDHVAVVADAGHSLRFRVTGVNAGGARQLTSPSGYLVAQADRDHDGALTDTDCDDANPAVHPGAADVPANGVDEDCSSADAPAPHLTLKARHAQHLGRVVKVKALSNLAVTVSVTGTVAISGSGHRRFELAGREVALVAGQRQTVRLELSKKALRACRAALHRGDRVRATLLVSGPAAAGRRRVVLTP